MSQSSKVQPVTTDRLWSIRDVSAFLGVPVGTLYQWRYVADRTAGLSSRTASPV